MTQKDFELIVDFYLKSGILPIAIVGRPGNAVRKFLKGGNQNDERKN